MLPRARSLIGFLHSLSPFKVSMLSIRKTGIAAVAAGSLLIGANPASALTTPLINPGAVLPLSPAPSAGLSALGFNQTNFPAIWAAAPSGSTPQLTDVRIFTRGRIAGSFTIENYNPNTAIPVNSPALSFKENANGMNSADLPTTNTTGIVPKATVTTSTTNDFTNPGGTPPGTPPASSCATGWQAGTYFPNGVPPFIPPNTQIWNCTTTTTTPGQQAFTINPSSALTSTNWSLIGGGNINGIASSFWSGNTISIPSFISLTFPSFAPSARSATFTLDGTAANNYLDYSYTYVQNQVPAPLPVLGAGLAFSFSRRLRRRIKSSATLAS